MASIGCNTTHNSVELYLYDLSKDWTLADGQRYVDWYIGYSGYPTTSSYHRRKLNVKINESTSYPGVYDGGYHTFTGLESSHTYYVYCEVWANGEILAIPPPGQFRTDKAPDWNLATSGWGNMDTMFTNSISEDLSHLFMYYYALMYRAEVTFEEDCHVEIYSEGSLDV